MGQEEYLMGVPLKRKKFRSKLPLCLDGEINPRKFNDHEHCDFCTVKISEYPGDLHEGFCTLDEYIWICPECYEDFKDDFHWRLVETPEMNESGESLSAHQSKRDKEEKQITEETIQER